MGRRSLDRSGVVIPTLNQSGERRDLGIAQLDPDGTVHAGIGATADLLLTALGSLGVVEHFLEVVEVLLGLAIELERDLPIGNGVSRMVGRKWECR